VTPATRRALALGLRAVAAIACLVLVARLLGSERLLQQLRTVEPGWFLAAIAVSALAQFTSALRWASIARALGLVAPRRPLVVAYAQGVAANALLPGATLGGDALRSIRLQRLGNPAARSALSVLIDRASGLWVLCALSALALALWMATADSSAARLSSSLGAAWVGPYALGLLVVLVGPWLPWRPHPASGSRLDRVHDLLVRIHGIVTTARRSLLMSLPASIAVQALSAAALWLCARAIGVSTSYAAVLAIAAPLFVAAALPVSIGGFGPREAVALLVFPLIGVPPVVGVAAAALLGVAALLLGLAFSPLLLWTLAHERR